MPTFDPEKNPALLLRLEKGEAPQVCPPAPPPAPPAEKDAAEAAPGVGGAPNGQSAADKAEDIAVMKMVSESILVSSSFSYNCASEAACCRLGTGRLGFGVAIRNGERAEQGKLF